MVNQHFVELFSASQNPVGRRVRLANPDASKIDGEWFTVVGVMPDIRHRDDVDPMVYLPLNQTAPATISILIGPREVREQSSGSSATRCGG